MTNDIEVRWDRMTAPDLREAAREKTVVIIPLGATEQHGPHLPTQVDWRSAYEISLRAARLMAALQARLQLARQRICLTVTPLPLAARAVSCASSRPGRMPSSGSLARRQVMQT